MRTAFLVASLAFLLIAASAFILAFGKVKRDPLKGMRSGEDASHPKVFIETSSGIREFSVEIADSLMEHAQGLSGRASLAEDEGMLFLYTAPAEYGFWMKDMKFPIDIVWILDGAVLGASENTAPEPGVPLYALKKYYPPEPADTVLEINAGLVEKHGIQAGDRVVIQ